MYKKIGLLFASLFVTFPALASEGIDVLAPLKERFWNTFFTTQSALVFMGIFLIFVVAGLIRLR